MTFEAIRGQERAIGYLKTTLAGGRIPSAMLFLGAHGVGKQGAALALAQALNCNTAPGLGCEQCSPCRKIAAGVHTDMTVIAPDGQFIKIDQVRALSAQLALVPVEARKRVIIVRQAERMNAASANAFLKTLEEPPEDTLLVLTAESASSLLETIVSRCMPLRFSLLAPETIRAILAEEGGLTGDELEFVARHAQGRLRGDLQRHTARWMALREAVLGALEEIAQCPFDEVAAWAQKCSAAEDWPFVIECLESWFRDIMVVGGGGAEERIINNDRREVLRRWVRAMSPEQAGQAHREILTAQEAMRLNVNRPLALEALWLNLKRLARVAA